MACTFEWGKMLESHFMRKIDNKDQIDRRFIFMKKHLYAPVPGLYTCI